MLDESNYPIISANLFRVQKITSKDYFFRHHLETNVEVSKSTKDVLWKRKGLNGINGVIKIRVNHIGKIVHVGEY